MGGRTVQEVPLAHSNEGLVRTDVDEAADDTLSLKLVRLKGLKPDAIDALRKDSLFRYKLEELVPPYKTRDWVRALPVGGTDYCRVAGDYKADPSRWGVGKKASFDVPDLWFWNCPLAAGISQPYRLKTTFDLEVPADGDYAFGASSTQMVRVSVDGRKVFFRDPDEPAVHAASSAKDLPDDVMWEQYLDNPGYLADEDERRGFVGTPVFLKAGVHRLNVEQTFLSVFPTWNEILRAVWKRPGGQVETLPLELMRPVR
jgi:hypothetical protein